MTCDRRVVRARLSRAKGRTSHGRANARVSADGPLRAGRTHMDVSS